MSASAAVVGLLVAAALALGPGHGLRTAGRLPSVGTRRAGSTGTWPHVAPAVDRWPRWSAPASRRAVAVTAALAVAVSVGGATGALAGLVTGFGVHLGLRRLPTLAEQQSLTGLRADLPWAGDLIAAAVATGAAVQDAVRVTGEALAGPLGRELVLVARALDLGAAPAAAWQVLLRDPAGATLARPLVRAAERGSPPSSALARVSVELRREAYDRAAAAAEVAAVRAVGPLGLCFLPAFVLLAVLPLVAGLAGSLLRSAGAG